MIPKKALSNIVTARGAPLASQKVGRVPWTCSNRQCHPVSIKRTCPKPVFGVFMLPCWILGPKKQKQRGITCVFFPRCQLPRPGNQWLPPFGFYLIHQPRWAVCQTANKYQGFCKLHDEFPSSFSIHLVWANKDNTTKGKTVDSVWLGANGKGHQKRWVKHKSAIATNPILK